jgi:putative component of toxin-antitoxin plasmid stabilization module
MERAAWAKGLCLPLMIYIINGMFAIELEPEVQVWLEELSFPLYQRVMRNVDDYLVDRGDLLDGCHTKALRDGVRELRVILGETSWRITYWLPSGRGRMIVLLTAFQKTREGPQHDDVERALKARQICEATHLDATTHVFERSG